jgi:hypothetical protein
MSEWNDGEGASRSPAAADLDARTRTDLLEIARSSHIPDADLMRRDELIAALRKRVADGPLGEGSATTAKASDALETLSRGELLQMAQERNVAGGGAMSRAALVAALAAQAENPATVPSPPTGISQPHPRAAGPAHASRSMPTAGAVPGAAAAYAASSVGDAHGNPRPSSSPPTRGTDTGRKRPISGSLPPRRVLIPGAILCLALLGAGLAAGSMVGSTAGATAHTSVFTTTIRGRIITVNGKGRKILVPAKTIHRKGKTVTIPAHTVDVTDTQFLPGPATTVNGTVFRTLRVPVTVTGPGRTETTTQTVTGPVTTVIHTVVSTDIQTDTLTVTTTVTAPPVT